MSEPQKKRIRLVIATVGCNGLNISEFIDLLRNSSIQMVLDTRTSRKYQYVGAYGERDLPEILSWWEIAYSWVPSLAPGKELRQRYEEDLNNTFGAWGKFLKSYKQKIIAEDAYHSAEVQHALTTSDRIAVLCTEEHFADCHRHVAAEYLAERHGGAEVIHLMKRKPRRDKDKAGY